MEWYRGPRSRIVFLSAGFAIVALAVVLRVAIAQVSSSKAGPAPTPTLTTLQKELEAGIDPGTPLHGTPAPDFTLTDQFGQQVSLSQFRGKVVVLAFTDSQCTTICPLTTQSMLAALQLLPASAAQQVTLLGLNANPAATSIADVRDYSVGHGLENKWRFLTGTPTQLEQVWKAYHVYVQIVKDNLDHTPALYVIGPNGGEQTVFTTSGQYGVVGVEAYALAAAIAPLLPGHVQLQQQLPPVRVLSTTQPVSLPALTANGATGGQVTLGPGSAQLLFFFASWSPDIQQKLEALNEVARMPGGPRVIAVDVGSTEPSPSAAQTLLRSLAQPLAYPVALDQTGDVADAYQAQDIPWFTLTSAKGAIMGSHDGWESAAAIEQGVRQALQSAP